MKCPKCKCRTNVEIDLHADGFAQDIRECSECGCVWTFKDDELKICKESND